MAECLTQAGACVGAVNYALAPLVTLAEIVRQCRAAVAWVQAHAGERVIGIIRNNCSGSIGTGDRNQSVRAPGERNGQYRHGERTKAAIAERRKFSILLKMLRAGLT